MPARRAGPLAILALTLLLLTLPVTLPLALGRWQDRRHGGIADRTHCSRCGHLIGQAALLASGADHMAALGAMRRRFPHGRVNVVRHTDARCTACGGVYAGDRQRHLLRPLEDATPPAPRLRAYRTP